MKILHLPLNVAGSEQVGQGRGFREVFEDVYEFDYLKYAGQNGNEATNREFMRIVEEWKPDLGWFQLQETNVLTAETFAYVRENYPDFWTTSFSGDARTYVPPYLYSILPQFDIFYNATDQEKMYEGICRRYEFMPIAVDPIEVTTFKEVEGVPEIIFIGNHYGIDAFPNSRNRYDTMAALSQEFGDKFGVYGTGWPETGDIHLMGGIPLKDQGSYYHAAKVVISMDHFNDMRYWSERRLWALASGSEVLMENHPGAMEEFGDYAYFFEGPHAAVSMARLSSGKDDLLDGKEFILNNHTWTQRALQVRKDYLAAH